MEWNLQPKLVELVNEEAGAYYIWSPSDSSVLSAGKLGAGKLVLHPRRLVMPHYADSRKIGYVIQGSCTVGLIPANSSEETVLLINEGDAIVVPLGAISWWYNGGDSDVIIVYLGETKLAYAPGEFTYFYLTGTEGVLGGFPTEVISKIYSITEEQSKTLTTSQTAAVMAKVNEGTKMPEPCKKDFEKFAFNLEKGCLMNAENFPLLKEVGLSAKFDKIDANSTYGPVFTTDSSFQMIYVHGGSGTIQIVGLNGKIVLNTKVETGQLFVVPKFFVAVQIADAQGMDCFSVITSSQPAFGTLAGKDSVLKTLSPSVVEASFNVPPGFLEILN